MAQNYWGDELPSRVDLPPAADPARPRYGRIDFDKLPNTRDLGGMVGAGGRRVKHGLLLRSGTLGFGFPADIDRLRDDYDLRLVVDFRNLIELSELPDPMDLIPAARYLHAEIFPTARWASRRSTRRPRSNTSSRPWPRETPSSSS